MGDAGASFDQPPARGRLHLPRGRRVRGALSGRIGGLAAGAVAYAILALLFLPPVAFLVAGVWGFIAYARALVQLWNALAHWQLDTFFTRLNAVDVAARTGLAGGAYFALLFALIVVFAGALGRGGRRWFLLPGIILALPAAVLFALAGQSTHVALAHRLALPAFAATLLTAYALCDAVVLAALLLDLRPRRPRRSGRRPMSSPRAVPAPDPIAVSEPSAHSLPQPALDVADATPAVTAAPQPLGSEPLAVDADDARPDDALLPESGAAPDIPA